MYVFTLAGNVFTVCFRPFWNRCLPKCLNKDTMLLGNCKAKIKKVSAAFAIALLSARLKQTVCYMPFLLSSFHFSIEYLENFCRYNTRYNS